MTRSLGCGGRARRSAYPRGKSSRVISCSGVSLRRGSAGCLWPVCLPQAGGEWKLGAPSEAVKGWQ